MSGKYSGDEDYVFFFRIWSKKENVKIGKYYNVQVINMNGNIMLNVLYNCNSNKRWRWNKGKTNKNEGNREKMKTVFNELIKHFIAYED